MNLFNILTGTLDTVKGVLAMFIQNVQQWLVWIQVKLYSESYVLCTNSHKYASYIANIQGDIMINPGGVIIWHTILYMARLLSTSLQALLRIIILRALFYLRCGAKLTIIFRCAAVQCFHNKHTTSSAFVSQYSLCSFLINSMALGHFISLTRNKVVQNDF